jgi:hypothetical protein
MPVPTEFGFIKFKGSCPFKFENKTSAAKWQFIELLIDTTFDSP